MRLSSFSVNFYGLSNFGGSGVKVVCGFNLVTIVTSEIACLVHVGIMYIWFSIWDYYRAQSMQLDC